MRGGGQLLANSYSDPRNNIFIGIVNYLTHLSVESIESVRITRNSSVYRVILRNLQSTISSNFACMLVCCSVRTRGLLEEEGSWVGVLDWIFMRGHVGSGGVEVKKETRLRSSRGSCDVSARGWTISSYFKYHHIMRRGWISQ